MILIVFLILIQRIILVDILHIRCRFIGSIVSFVVVIVVRRVALWVVDTLITLQDGCLLCIPIRPTEVMIVII